MPPKSRAMRGRAVASPQATAKPAPPLTLTTPAATAELARVPVNTVGRDIDNAEALTAALYTVEEQRAQTKRLKCVHEAREREFKDELERLRGEMQAQESVSEQAAIIASQAQAIAQKDAEFEDKLAALKGAMVATSDHASQLEQAAAEQAQAHASTVAEKDAALASQTQVMSRIEAELKERVAALAASRERIFQLEQAAAEQQQTADEHEAASARREISLRQEIAALKQRAEQQQQAAATRVAAQDAQIAQLLTQLAQLKSEVKASQSAVAELASEKDAVAEQGAAICGREEPRHVDPQQHPHQRQDLQEEEKQDHKMQEDTMLGRDKMWSQMTVDEQMAVQGLGWSADSWDQGDDASPFERQWEEMQTEARQYSMLLGFDESDFRGDFVGSPRTKSTSDHHREAAGGEDMVPADCFTNMGAVSINDGGEEAPRYTEQQLSGGLHPGGKTGGSGDISKEPAQPEPDCLSGSYELSSGPTQPFHYAEIKKRCAPPPAPRSAWGGDFLWTDRAGQSFGLTVTVDGRLALGSDYPYHRTQQEQQEQHDQQTAKQQQTKFGAGTEERDEDEEEDGTTIGEGVDDTHFVVRPFGWRSAVPKSIIGPYGLRFKRVRSDLLINVAGWEIVGDGTPQKHVVYSINIVVMGENFTKTARWSLIRQFHLACFDLNEHIGTDKHREYRLKFPEKWKNTFSVPKLDSRRLELNVFFAEFCAWFHRHPLEPTGLQLLKAEAMRDFLMDSKTPDIPFRTTTGIQHVDHEHAEEGVPPA